jgi:hypothetical protein
MIRRSGVVMVWFVLLAASAGAELKYTMKVEARPSTVSAAATGHPLLSVIGPLVVESIAPAGGVELRAIVGERGARMEYSRAYTIIPAGGALIVSTDGSIVVVNPAAKTFWRMAAPQAARAAQVAPDVKVSRTGAFETILGVRAEHATIDIRMALPLPAEANLPGIPADLAITGEAWLADQFRKYVGATGFAAIAGTLGPGTLAAAGFPMRSIMRSEIFGGQQIESIVTSIEESPAPAGAFDVPAGFTEVPPQIGGFPGPGR